jgi:two-component system chemotaxis response regulator CheB
MSVDHQPIRILVVDDSLFMRNRISMMLMKCADLKVVGIATDGVDAIAQAERTQPDVMTLDVEMPGMNGLEVLDHMMVHHPLPIIMVSAWTEEGAAVTLQALERGAVDFIAKPMNSDLSEMGMIEGLLQTKVREAFQLRRRLPLIRHMEIHRDRIVDEISSGLKISDRPKPSESAFGKPSHNHVPQTSKQTDFPLVVVGASTGGPNLLKTVVRDLPSTFPAALLIVQHMPKYFTKVFADNLDAVATIPIREAQDGDALQPGVGFVVPGDHHGRVIRQGDGKALIALSAEPLRYPYRPSIDCAMTSAAEQFGSLTVGVVLTGMGDDGMTGCQRIKEHGGIILAQDEATSLIYGMPRAVVEARLADRVVSDVEIITALMQAVDSICVINR